jgi:hypothetical protein
MRDFEIRIGESGYSRRITVKLEDTILNAVENLAPGNRIYLNLSDLDWYKVCIIAKLLMNKGQIPDFIFSFKEDRETFFRYFYGATVDGEPFSNVNFYKYLVADFSGAPSSMWNGLSRTMFNRLPEDTKISATSNLTSRWSDEPDNSQVKIFVKTMSRNKETGNPIEYDDYEDLYLQNQQRKEIIFVTDIDSLPRPEKFSIVDFKILPVIEDPIQIIKTVDEAAVGIPKMGMSDNANRFFLALDFPHKVRFSILFVRLIWSKFTKASEIADPDEFEKLYFSKDSALRNQLSSVFYEIKTNLLSYNLENLRILTGKFEDPNLVFNLNESRLSNLQQLNNSKLFVPNQVIFSKIFNFMFAKDLVYSDLFGKDYEWLENNLNDYVAERLKELNLTTTGIRSYERIDPEEKIVLQEQFGEYKDKEIECKKLILVRPNGKRAFMFIPINSKSSMSGVKRNGKSVTIKLVDLLPGDIFEKEYWTYGRLISALSNRKDITSQDEKLKQSIEISQNFRKSLERFLLSINKDSVVGGIEERLEEGGHNGRTINYMTVASWIDTVMAPIEDSELVISALIKIFHDKYPDSGINFDSKEFMNACTYIKSRRNLLDDLGEDVETRKEAFRIEKVEPLIVKVRGENIGRICAIA